MASQIFYYLQLKKLKKKINCSPTKDINKILKDSIFWERYINSN